MEKKATSEPATKKESVNSIIIKNTNTPVAVGLMVSKIKKRYKSKSAKSNAV
jgi:hypothetical protein